ncbi:MAG: hypothetical protein JWM32_701 [Verrucomicrobia bacterium]|nr:hypothetical protein [Verrucomicrobiota bacterium]
MIPKFIRLSFVALLAAAATPLRAQLLWPGTTSGMSVEQVQSLFPPAHAPVEAIKLPGGRAEELLELDEYEIVGRKFRVAFFFKARRLLEVALLQTGELGPEELEKFKVILRAKYGTEYSTRSGEYIQVKWNAVQTVILLTWTPLGRGIATLSISYEAPIIDDAIRL